MKYFYISMICSGMIFCSAYSETYVTENFTGYHSDLKENLDRLAG